ncbi:MAG: putative O-glycosylation ligase, exosortase A system-associated [Acetobacteraceae bacterium]
MLPISFYSAHLGVILWIWVALLSPNDLLYGILGGVPFNKLVTASTVLAIVMSREKKQFYMDGLLTLVAVYAAVVTLSYIFESYPGAWSDLQYDKFWKEMILLAMITGLIWSQHRLHHAALAVSLAFGFFMVKEALIFLLTAGGHPIAGTPSTGDNNGLALAVLMTIPLLLFCARYSAVTWVKLAMQATAGLGGVTVIASYSRGGFIGLIVLAFMLLKNSKYKARTFAALGVFAFLMWLLVPTQYVARMDTINTAAEDDSFVVRLVAWKVNFLMALDHPFLGSGLYASLSWQNWSNYVVRSTDFLFPTPILGRSFVAHSIYFQVLGDTGFTGLFLFIAILVTALMMAAKTRRLAGKDPNLAWAADLARALQVSIVVYCISGAALSLVYFELLFVLLAMISRTHRTVQLAVGAVKTPARASVPQGFEPAYRRAV